MLLLLPPSETKRDGGADGTFLNLSALSFPELTPQRKAVIAALRTLSRNLAAATGALGLGPTQRFEIGRNREITRSPVLPAIDRYSGVLYDALDTATLSAAASGFAARSTVIHSALFGLLRAGDLIPAYRLSHNSRLPGLSLARTWRAPIAEILHGTGGLILDLRSEAYVSMGPAPERPDSVYVRVLSVDDTGERVALSHFNKRAKGEFVRSILESGIDHDSVDSVTAWAAGAGIGLSLGAPGELNLVV